MNKIETLVEIIKKSTRIVVMTGAGFSVPSGIPDFRSSDGVYSKEYEGLAPEQIISHSFFISNPETFYRFYKEKMVYQEALPNIAHRFLAKIEKSGKLNAIVTQNIDGLDSLAGCKNVLELHGSIMRNYCMKCGSKYGLDVIMTNQNIPLCPKCGGMIKPDVVLYEESLNEEVTKKAIEAISNAQTLLVVGTSLRVYPAAGLIRYFKGQYLIIINLSKTLYDNYANLVINEPLEKVFALLDKEIEN